MNRTATGIKRKTVEQMTRRKPQMTVATLSPIKGAINMRLNPTVGHFPRIKKENLVCQLQRTANRKLFKSNVIPSGAQKKVCVQDAVLCLVRPLYNIPMMNSIHSPYP